MNEQKVVSLVPMRHHSQRVPGKNYRILADRPLYAYILEVLGRCPEISRIVVDTDSPILVEGISKDFPGVEILPRPEELCADNIPMNDILLYDVSQIEGDVFLQTHSTNPLLKAGTISRAIQTYFEVIPGHDSLFSVNRFQTRLWTEEGDALNHDPAILVPTQDLKPLYVENSCMYLFSRNSLLEYSNRIGKNPYMFEISSEEAIDIDTEWDFRLAECMILGGNQGN